MNLLIYLVAFLEWFTTLSVEIVALRTFTPIIWSNSISTSIILWVILLALSYWYYIWWKMSSKVVNWDTTKIKKILILNLIIASLYYFFISFVFSSVVLSALLFSTWSYFFSILFASIILFFIPVFLASQTIPLLSELLKWNSLSWEKIWKLLFYSTVGSFAWAVWTSTLFFPLIWVFKTGVLSSIFLVLCALIMSIFFIKNIKMNVFLATLLVFFVYFNIVYENKNSKILFEKANAYHNIKIYDADEKRIFSINWSYSSGINLDNKKSFFWYIKETEKKLYETKSKNILVIWAAGFTLPNDVSHYDFVKNIDVIDIDSSLKNITEKYFLEKKLSDKIKFFPEPSRFFLNRKLKEKKFKKYDFILIDAYSGKTPPAQLLTLEFFENLNKIWNNIYLNIILDVKLESDFSKNVFATVNKAFWKSYYKNVSKKKWRFANILITNQKNKTYLENKINLEKVYRDDKNTIELDIFKMQSLLKN